MKNKFIARLQKLFNIAYAGLASQDWRQSISNGSCCYKSESGDRCAVGHLAPLPDLNGGVMDHKVAKILYEADVYTYDEYSKIIENAPVHDVPIVGFLLSMQSAHDSHKENMNLRFSNLARKYKLNLPL